MEYIDAAITSILSPHVLSVEDLQEMLMPTKVELPSTMYLPVSSDDTLHFFRYLCTHILVAEEQFLLLIDVPIQDHAQQLEIYQVSNLLIPQGNLSAQHNIDNLISQNIIWWNKSNWNFRTAIHHMSKSQLTILQTWGTTPTTCQPNIMHHSHLCQG